MKTFLKLIVILLIDSGYSFSTDLIREELKKITDKKIVYIINTHFNGDHTDGNALLGQDACIIAHRECFSRLATNTQFAAEGLPDITFQDSLTIWFNNEEIALKYLPGHSDTDIIVQLSEHADKNQGAGIESHSGRQRSGEAKKSGVLKGWENWNSKVFPGYMTTNNWIDNLYSVLPEGNALSAYTILRKKFEQSGLKAMLATYKGFSDPEKAKYYFIETDINNWGYALMAENKFTDAIGVLKINTERFPGSANAFDSLGEAYMKTGNKELAIKHYEKSLELNPQNANAAEQLKKLKIN